MKNCLVVVTIVLFAVNSTAMGQKKPLLTTRLGASVSFALNNIAANNVGIGGMAGVEKPVSKSFSAEAEMSYTYFTGDGALYAEGKNKAYTLPVMAGIKFYPLQNIYASLRTGAVYFLLNNMSSARIRMTWGIAGGINLPKKINRVNIQMGYTGFHYEGVQRGYATLAAAIIIN